MSNQSRQNVVVECPDGDPARMLHERRAENDITVDIHLPQEFSRPLPVVEYEVGRFPSVRVFHGRNREVLCNVFAMVLDASTYTEPHALGDVKVAADHFQQLTQCERIVVDLWTSEIGDIVSLLNRSIFEHLRELGVVLLQIEATGRDKVDLCTELAERFPNRPAELHRFLGEEIRHAYNCIRELSSYIYPHSISSEILQEDTKFHQTIVNSTSENLTYKLAQAIALLPDEIYSQMVRGISSELSGLTPFFRVFTPTDVQQLGRYEIRGWFMSKEVDDTAHISQSFAQWSESRNLPPMDRPFIPLLAVQHLKALRTWGPQVLESLLEVGRKIREIGYAEDPKTFHGFIGGLTLIDGSSAKIPTNIATLMAYYRHSAWVEERERSFRYDSPSLRRPPRSEHVLFDPCTVPGEEYLPDLKKAIGFVHSLALWEVQSSPWAKALFNQLFTLTKPNSHPLYSIDSIQRMSVTGQNTHGRVAHSEWVFEIERNSAGETVSSNAAIGPQPMSIWSNLMRASGLDIAIAPSHQLSAVQEQVVCVEAELLGRDRHALQGVFLTLNSLDCFPLEGESLAIVQNLAQIAANRREFLNELTIFLLSSKQAQYPHTNSKVLPLYQLLKALPQECLPSLHTRQDQYERAITETRMKYGKETPTNGAPEVVLEDTQVVFGPLCQLISSRSLDDTSFSSLPRGGVTDDVYTEIFLREYLKNGNHLLIQKFDAESYQGFDGAFLFGKVGMVPNELSPIVRSLELEGRVSIAELALTAINRRPGTYKRLFRSMVAHVALEGGTASLGLVHEQNSAHIALLEASGHMLLRGLQIKAENVRTGGLNIYLPALLVIPDKR